MRIFSVCLLFGTLAIQWLDVLPSWKISAIFLALSLVLAFFLNVFLIKKQSKYTPSVMLAVVALLIGFAWANYHATQIINQRISPTLEGKELYITGKVVEIPVVREDGVRFLFNVFHATEYKSAVTENEPTKLRGIIRLGWYKTAEEIQSGELWRLKVKLKRPSGFMNPGGFDYEKWLFTQKIIATGYVRESKKDARAENYKLAQTITPQTLWSADHLRQKIHESIQEKISDKPSAAVLSALLVAVRDSLSDQQWELLQATGTSHLIAISGLHIAVVAGFAFFPMLLIWRLFPRLNERIPLRVAGAIVGSLFAVFYAMLAGFTLPTQRALLMVIIGLWGLVSRRNFDAFSILALALVLVLIWDPLAAMTISFWLSFLAVCLILLFIKRQKEKQSWLMLKLQLFISIAMLPLSLLFFGTASLTSPLANLFAIPWVSLVIVPISLLGLILMPLSSFLSIQLLKLAAFAIDLLFKALELISSSALSALTFAETPISHLIIAFIGVLVVILPKGFPARYLGVLLFLPALTFQGDKLKHGEFEYTLLDVGQGYASVLQTQNHTLIYDTGTRVSETFDLGKLVVAPYLQAKGIKKINTMMISHEDIDHRGGAEYLQDNFEIDEILSSDTSVLADSKNCVQDNTWEWDGVNFEVLSPPRNFKGNDNNSSCVLKVWNEYHSLLLTGDIQTLAERLLLLSRKDKIKADVMAVPHHGSKTSSTTDFIQQVSPDIALISAGYRSRFGHPKPLIVNRYQDLDIELLDTVNHGAISLHFDDSDKEIKREYFRIENSGFWSRR